MSLSLSVSNPTRERWVIDGRTRLWGLHAAAITTVRPVANPLSGFGSLTEFHPYITVIQVVTG
jgi:hypothetical protein